MEIWKQIPNSPKYEVSNLGRLRHMKTKKIRKAKIDRGYEVNHIADANGRKRTRRRHRLVANAFLGVDDRFVEVDHIDRNRQNNRLENLRVSNREGNMLNRGAYDIDVVKSIIRLYESGKTPEEISEHVRYT